MRYLILPDIHTHFEKAEKIIKNESPDKIIFLGDYFDEFGDNPLISLETAKWLNWSINEPNRIHLIGNHDVSYLNPKFACSGFSNDKFLAIKEIFNFKNISNKLLWFYNLENKFLLTHAGLNKEYLPQFYNGFNLQILCEYLKEQSKHAFINLKISHIHWFYKAGFARFGSMPVGGIVWSDFRLEFKPIEEINQIFGHTPLFVVNSEKYLKTGKNSDNYCLDTIDKLSRYAIFNSKNLKLQIHENI